MQPIIWESTKHMIKRLGTLYHKFMKFRSRLEFWKLEHTIFSYQKIVHGTVQLWQGVFVADAFLMNSVERRKKCD